MCNRMHIRSMCGWFAAAATIAIARAGVSIYADTHADACTTLIPLSNRIKGSCTCWTSEMIGPHCNVSSVNTCSGRGTPLPTPYDWYSTPSNLCSCWDSAKGTGPTCSEYTDATTCNGNGKAQADGTCICFDSSTGKFY